MELQEFSKGLNLMLTYRCNYRCAHCISECGPERTEVMTYAQAKAIIDQAAPTGQFPLIGYTGGEPFLYYDTMKALMAYTYRTYGIPGGVVTNCFWATTPERAEAVLRELCDSGLATLTVSLDHYHLAYAKPEHIRNAVIASVRAGVYTVVNTVVSREPESISSRQARTLLQLPEDVACSDNLVSKELVPLLAGRAGDCPPERHSLALYAEACPSVGQTPAIDADGNLFACCCFGNSSVNPTQRIAYVGNANETPLPRLLEAMEHDLLLNLFGQLGPYAVLRLLQARDPALPFSGDYTTNCDICRELYGIPEIRAALRALLLELKSAPTAPA